MVDYAKIQVGIDGVSPPAGEGMEYLYEESSTQKFPIGQRVCCSNGAVFHYAYAAEALTRQRLISAAAVPAAQIYDRLTGTGTVTQIGKTAVDVVNSVTAITENEFQGGQLVVSSQVAGLAATQNLFIKSHPAASNGETITIQLLTPVQTNFTTQSKCGVVPNPFHSVRLYDIAAEGYALGITNIAVTSGYYFWLQTWGPTAGVNDAGPVVRGGPVAASSTTSGSISEFCITTIAAGIYPAIGTAGPWPGIASQTSPIFLTLVP
jgi:hypothetical protein